MEAWGTTYPQVVIQWLSIGLTRVTSLPKKRFLFTLSTRCSYVWRHPSC